MITAKKFKERLGFAPRDDDLRRCNCLLAGEIGHEYCGWDKERDMPAFMPAAPLINKKGAVEMNDTQILDWIQENVVEIHYGHDGKITMVALLGDNYIKKSHIGISLRECVNGILSIPD